MSTSSVNQGSTYWRTSIVRFSAGVVRVGKAWYALITGHRLQVTVGGLPGAHRRNDCCQFGRDGQPSEGAHISPSCISFGYEAGRRQDRGTDNAQHLGSKLLRLALTRRPSEHLPVNPDVLAR